MGDSEHLAAELHSLWVAGTISLPQVAAVYAQASRDANNTSWRENDAFAQPGIDLKMDWPPIEIVDDLGPVYPHWKALRNLLQAVMANTATNLVDAGIALCMIANEYAEGDDEAAARLRELSQERLADPGLDQPPTSIPEVRRPGDPHDTRTVEVEVPIPFGEDIVIEYEEPVR